MATLSKRTKRIGLALLMGLILLSGVVKPLAGDEAAGWLPGPDVVLAGEHEGSGG